MRKFEIYTVEDDGTIKPSGYWDRATKLSHIEDILNQRIKKLGRPCVIVTSNLTENDKVVTAPR